MCTLAFCKERKMTYSEFMTCAENNSDGIGFAWSSKKQQVYTKGFMDEKVAWEFYKRLPKDKPHLVHFRLGTAGDNVEQLTHPFIISEDSPTPLTYIGDKPILFHNGALWGWQKDCKDNNIPTHRMMSDTRMVAILCHRNGVKETLKETSGKYIVLHKGNIYIKGHFINEDGVYFSNSWYKESLFRSYSSSYSTTRSSKTVKEDTSDWFVEDKYRYDDYESHFDYKTDEKNFVFKDDEQYSRWKKSLSGQEQKEIDDEIEKLFKDCGMTQGEQEDLEWERKYGVNPVSLSLEEQRILERERDWQDTLDAFEKDRIPKRSYLM